MVKVKKFQNRNFLVLLINIYDGHKFRLGWETGDEKGTFSFKIPIRVLRIFYYKINNDDKKLKSTFSKYILYLFLKRVFRYKMNQWLISMKLIFRVIR